MKKILFGALALAFAFVATPAFATSTIINIEEGMVSSILEYVGDLFSGVYLLVLLVIGLPLAFWVVRRVIGLVRVR